jgi:hypothetical protein
MGQHRRSKVHHVYTISGFLKGKVGLQSLDQGSLNAIESGSIPKERWQKMVYSNDNWAASLILAILAQR